MNLEVCSGLNIVSHTGQGESGVRVEKEEQSRRVSTTECGKRAVFCVSISSFSETILKPGGDGTRAGRPRSQEQLPAAQENKLNPLLVFFVLLHYIIYAGQGQIVSWTL